MDSERKHFDAILEEERKSIGKPDGDLIGLAFSGGGIRSATFNLGVIQGLARLRLLGRFDYLSTVSGGGYIGAWFSAWLKRHFQGDVAALQAALLQPRKPGQDPEPAAIWWLRRYSNYLTPKTGLSGDTLAALGQYLRNLLINQLGLVALFSTILLLPQFLRRLLPLADAPLTTLAPLAGVAWGWFAVAALCVLIALAFTALNLQQAGAVVDSGARRDRCRLLHAPGVSLAVLVPAVLASVALSHGLYGSRPDLPLGVAGRGALWQWLVGGAIGYSAAWLLAWRLARPITRLIAAICPNCATIAAPPRLHVAAILLVGLPAGVLAGWLLHGFVSHLDALELARAGHWNTGYGVPLLLLGFWLTVVLQSGLTGRLAGDMPLEWWSRLGGLLLAVAAAWAGLHTLIRYGPAGIEYLQDWAAAGGAAWLASTLAGVVLGKGRGTDGKHSQPWREALTRLAPWVFILGLFLLLAWGWHRILLKLDDLEAAPDTATASLYEKQEQVATPRGPVRLETTFKPAASPTYAEYLGREHDLAERVDTATLGYATLGSVLIWLLLFLRLDVNLFSLHHFYRNRLTRCYLGATRSQDDPPRGETARNPHPFTGFDPDDDLNLADFVSLDPAGKAERAQRPYPIVNAAMNLVGGSDLAWQTRKAAAFFMSPLYSGFEFIYHGRSEQPGSAPTRDSANQGSRVAAFVRSRDYMEGVPLGTAMAISGAAVSPNMGYHSSPSVAFLLAAFNVRLGHWCGNPYHPGAHLDRRSPPFGGWYLLLELLGMTRHDGPYVYLSDGGHFENLGVYELVRRRCRHIVVVDAGQDRRAELDDLANLIRKCYTDFGALIEIEHAGRLCRRPDAEQPCPNPEGWSGAYAVTGRIDYGKDAAGQPIRGRLLYIKPGLLGDEPPDILNYRTAHAEFPHESTGDQFFDENQFEAYRKLGRHIVLAVLRPALRRMEIDPDTTECPEDRFGELLDTVAENLSTVVVAPAGAGPAA